MDYRNNFLRIYTPTLLCVAILVTMINGDTAAAAPQQPLGEEYLNKALAIRHSTEARAQVRDCVVQSLNGLDWIATIQATGDLIEYVRDELLPALGSVRRTAAGMAREQGQMNVHQIAAATGATPATVRRLITESRDV